LAATGASVRRSCLVPASALDVDSHSPSKHQRRDTRPHPRLSTTRRQDWVRPSPCHSCSQLIRTIRNRDPEISTGRRLFQDSGAARLRHCCRPRYTPTSVFITFPWPDKTNPDQRGGVADVCRRLLARWSEICLAAHRTEPRGRRGPPRLPPVRLSRWWVHLVALTAARRQWHVPIERWFCFHNGLAEWVVRRCPER
jgi:hypothetical protein